MMNSFLQSVLESFTDVAQNGISLAIFLLLSALIVALILAVIFPSWQKALVTLRVLEEDEKPSSMLSWFVGAIIVVKLVQAFLLQPFIVDGASMLPTFHDKEFLLVDKFSYLVGNPKRGDVVVFKLYEGGANQYSGKYLIKRIIGLPGERIVIRNGVTTVYNSLHPEGFIVDESYIQHKDASKQVDMVLDPDHYFVMGDNRAQSYDSRSWGALNGKDIKGQALLRVFPFSAFSYEPGRHVYK